MRPGGASASDSAAKSQGGACTADARQMRCTCTAHARQMQCTRSAHAVHTQCTRSAHAVHTQRLHEVFRDVTQRDRTLAQLVVRRVVDAVSAEVCWRRPVATLCGPEAGQSPFEVLSRVRVDEHGAAHGHRRENSVVYHLVRARAGARVRVSCPEPASWGGDASCLLVTDWSSSSYAPRVLCTCVHYDAPAMHLLLLE